MSDSPAENSRPDPERLRRWLEYAGARCLLAVLSRLPMNSAIWVGRKLGGMLRRLDRRHRQRAYDQVRDRLGLDDAQADAFVRKNFEHYGMVLAEFCTLARLTPEQILDQVDLNGFDAVAADVFGEGRGMLLVTGHYGNWEWSNTILRCMGYEGGSIARPLDNHRVNELVRKVRERNGFRILDKEGAIRKAFARLKRKGTVGVLPDQDAGRNGMNSPFLGKPASTLAVPVELVLRTGSPIVVVVARRNPPGSAKHFTMVYRPPLRPDTGADPNTEARRLVDAINDQLSDIILEQPDQWFWIHRRWKSVGER